MFANVPFSYILMSISLDVISFRVTNLFIYSIRFALLRILVVVLNFFTLEKLHRGNKQGKVLVNMQAWHINPSPQFGYKNFVLQTSNIVLTVLNGYVAILPTCKPPRRQGPVATSACRV